MADPDAHRTLVKSPPELWAEISDVAALARHLGEFGEIRITRLEEESTVAWEGERASGTVELAPSGWGTRVTLTAREMGPEPVAAEPEPVAAEPEPKPEPEPEPVAAEPEPVVAEPDPVMVEPGPEPGAAKPVAEPAPPRAGLFARLFRRRRAALAEPEAEPVAEAEPDAAEPAMVAEPVAAEPEPDAAEPEMVAEPDAAEPEMVAEPGPVAPEPVAEAESVAEPEPEPAAEAEPTPDTLPALTSALDSLGAAHHRPFSRG
jgi:hypothetical protein